MKLRYAVLAASYVFATLGFVPSPSAQQGPRNETSIEEDPLQQPLPPGIKVRVFIHRPRVVEPNHLGTCTETIAANVDDNALAGWHLPASGITWKLNVSTVPTGVDPTLAHDAIDNAFSTWNAADSGKRFFDGGRTNAKATRLDGTNAILWKKLSPSTIGVTYVWYYTSSDEVAEVDTAFNSRYPWAIFNPADGECQSSPDAYDLQDIATHEFGHWVGLDDLYNDTDKDLTMYGFGAGGELKKRTLGTGDISGANEVAP